MSSGESVSVTRSGNLLQVEATPAIQRVLQQLLTYKHKESFHGAELKERKAIAANVPGMNPFVQITHRALYNLKDGKLYCAGGLEPNLRDAAQRAGAAYSFVDRRQNKLPPAKFERLLEIGDLEFRHRQDEVLATIDVHDGGVIEAPTGYGKSFLATLLTKVYPDAPIMFVAPGVDLIKSLFGRLLKVTSSVGRIGDGHHEPDKRVLLVSADSIHKAPIHKAQLVVYDEVHSAGTDRRAAALTERYTEAKFIGFTASPDKRMDGADALVRSIFGPILMRVSYAEAQAAGMVAAIDTWMVPVPPDLSIGQVSGTTEQKKRRAYWCNDHRNAIIAQAVRQTPQILGCREPQTLLMVETVTHLFELRKYLPNFQPIYANINDRDWHRLQSQGLVTQDDYVTKKRRDYLLRKFEKGELRCAIATHCWKQGIDPIHLQVFGRVDGGVSGINNIQLPGRLSRVTDQKDRGLLLDCGDEFDDWARQRALARMKDYKQLGFKLLNPAVTPSLTPVGP